MISLELPRLDNYYQPIPFDGYYQAEGKRQDCEQRYQKMKKSYGNFTGKSLLDFGCAEGFFMWRFMQDGGVVARGIEIDQAKCKFINQLALVKKLQVSAESSLGNGASDIGIYLDLYGDSHESIQVFNTIVQQCTTVFVSRSGCEGDGRDLKLLEHIKKLGLKSELLYKGFCGREILRCEK